jgi:hypothetical protein
MGAFFIWSKGAANVGAHPVEKERRPTKATAESERSETERRDISRPPKEKTAARESGQAELTKISRRGRAQDPNVPFGLGEGPVARDESAPGFRRGALKRKGDVQSKED